MTSKFSWLDGFTNFYGGETGGKRLQLRHHDVILKTVLECSWNDEDRVSGRVEQQLTHEASPVVLVVPVIKYRY